MSKMLIVDGNDNVCYRKRVVLITRNKTAERTKRFVKKLWKKGADEYITKPIDFKHLNECILFDLIMRNKD